MGVKAFRNRDGSEGVVHIANLGIRDVSARADARVNHPTCCPGFIVQRLSEGGRPTGKLFCCGCKNTLGKRIIPMYRDRTRHRSTEVRWEFIPGGSCLPGSHVPLEGDHRLLYVSSREIKPLVLQPGDEQASRIRSGDEAFDRLVEKYPLRTAGDEEIVFSTEIKGKWRFSAGTHETSVPKDADRRVGAERKWISPRNDKEYHRRVYNGSTS